MTPQTKAKTILDNPTVLERAIIYARVSTDEQAESGTSIDNQVEKSLAYAAAHNLQVPEEFIFREDYTGKVLDRPELNKVRKLLQTGQADSVIVYKTNRLDRSEWGLNLLILLQEFKQLGVSLHYSQAGRKVDLTNPVEALMQSIEGWQAGEDHRETVTKLHEGIENRAKSGYIVPIGNRPFGYKKIRGEDRENQPEDSERRKRESKLWFFEIIEKEAAIVRLIFTWYVLGDETGKTLSMSAIADKLNAMGHITRDGKKWIRAAVYSVLIGEVYCGVWHYGKISKRLENPIPVEVPSIVSRELWQAAQEQLEHNKVFAQRNRKPGRYLLANRVTCGECGYRITGKVVKSHGVTYTYYNCATVDNREMASRRECHLPGFKGDMVDTKIWDRLEAVSRDKKQLIEGLVGYQARQESKVEPIRRELGHVEDLIKDKTAEWESAYLDQKLLTSERAKARKALEIDQLEQVLNGLEKRKAELLTELEDKSLTEEQIMGTVAFAFQVAEDMDKLRKLEAMGQDNPQLKAAVYESKRRLLAILDVQVTLFVEDGRKKAKMTAKYCPDGLTVELDSTNSTLLNRQNWLIFSEVIDLE